MHTHEVRRWEEEGKKEKWKPVLLGTRDLSIHLHTFSMVVLDVIIISCKSKDTFEKLMQYCSMAFPSCLILGLCLFLSIPALALPNQNY